ncbi:hypothetical protein GCM10020255_041040 [Rhodococcus baikonurensis]
MDMVSVEDSRESAPRVASKIEQMDVLKDALKADVVAKVSVNSVDPTSADTAALTSAKPRNSPPRDGSTPRCRRRGSRRWDR